MSAYEFEADLYVYTGAGSHAGRMIVIDVTEGQASTQGPTEYRATLRGLLPNVMVQSVIEPSPA